MLLRETLRRELGEERDRCFEPSIVGEVLTALTNEGDEASALALAKECLARAKPDAYSREQAGSIWSARVIRRSPIPGGRLGNLRWARDNLLHAAEYVDG